MSKVVIVLGPGIPSETPLTLAEAGLLNDPAGTVLPYPENNILEENTIYTLVNPNSALLNDLLNNSEIKLVIQAHTIGEISQTSTDLFLKDKPEHVISNFTRLQHQYKRLIDTITTTELHERMVILQTGIDDPEEIRSILNVAKQYISVPVVQEQPAETVVDEPINFDEPAEEVKEPEPIPESTETEPETKVEEPVPEVKIEEPVAEVKIEEPMVETSPVEKEEEFDPMATIETQAKEVEPERSVEAEIPPEKESLLQEDFEAALINSLEEVSATTVKTDAVDVDVNSAPAYGIPEEYPNVDQTVTYDPSRVFSEPSEEGKNEKGEITDWAADPHRFVRLHDRVSKRFTTAIERGVDPVLSEFERGIIQYGEDQVSVPEMHKFQYVDGARWSGTVKSPTASVPIIMPIRNPDYGDAKYVGPESVSLLQNRMKIGCKLGVFLPHTGIYFVIVSPGDDQFLDTLSIINNQRIVALRASSGILLGNSNFYINRQVMNLFLDSIVHCSLGAWNRENLMELIDERDINIIANALGASIYPDGYDYVQLCGLKKTDKTICEHITRKTVDLRRLVFVDNSRLSENQKIFAAGALKERSIKEVKDYQDANYIGYKKGYEITEGVEFVYRAQPARVSIEAGEKWIKEIEAIVDNIITFREDEETRNAMVEQRINLTRIREYSHWVHEIHVDGQPITDHDKINKLLNSLSRNKEVVDKVSETLLEFQRLSSIAMVAVPRVQCPSCEKTSEKDLDISTHLIPQDAVSRLFTLVRQRL